MDLDLEVAACRLAGCNIDLIVAVEIREHPKECVEVRLCLARQCCRRCGCGRREKRAKGENACENKE